MQSSGNIAIFREEYTHYLCKRKLSGLKTYIQITSNIIQSNHGVITYLAEKFGGTKKNSTENKNTHRCEPENSSKEKQTRMSTIQHADILYCPCRFRISYSPCKSFDPSQHRCNMKGNLEKSQVS